MKIATGKFDVTLTPEAGLVPGGSAMRLTKQYHGALSGTGAGLMLAAHGTVAGSAGYVAIEQVTGSLDGRAGSFMLQHSGTMQAGRESLALTVVPDSGTETLSGLSGSMAIERRGADHAYRFEYAL